MATERPQLEGHKLLSHLDRLAEWRLTGDTLPVTVEISPASKCNHRCNMCGYDYLQHAHGVMDEALLLRIARELPESGVRGLVFAGDGEPFLNPALPAALTAARAAGADVAVSTNGVMIKEPHLPVLAEQLSWIRFSINGTTAEEYAAVHHCDPKWFGRVLEKVARLAREKAQRGTPIVVGTQLVVLPENVAGVADLARRLRDLGADYFVMKPFYYHPSNRYGERNLVDHERYRAQLEEAEALSDGRFRCVMRWETLRDEPRSYRRCLALPFFVYVRTDGEIHPCMARQGIEENSIGNLAETSFLELWHGERRRRVFERFAAVDVDRCQQNCRHHAMNRFLWELIQPQPHRNFV